MKNLILKIFVIFLISRAYECTTSTCVNKQMERLVNELKNKSFIKSSVVEEVFCSIDRKDFIDNMQYVDTPVFLGYGATISAPHMHAYAMEMFLEAIGKKKQIKVLDIGSGSGFLYIYYLINRLVAFAKMLKKLNIEAHVIGVEHIPQLVEISRQNIGKSHLNLLNDGTIKIYQGDGRKGYKPSSPYDYIHVGAAVQGSSTSTTITNQLSHNSMLFSPIEDDNSEQYIYIIEKDSQGKIKQRREIPVVSLFI
jgi:protein-L-isoaspartate(D-aspartate) O-methyltransferase